MRRKLIDKLYVGDLRDCAAAGPDWTVVHAAKHPCYHNKCGQTDPLAPNYLSHVEGSYQWLNMIDAEAKYFSVPLFNAFLKFTRDQWEKKSGPLLIHCNKGESRAPSLALLFLAKVLHRIDNSSYDAAWDDFEALAGEPYTPSAGIEQWLRDHWSELDQQQRLPSMDLPQREAAVAAAEAEFQQINATMGQSDWIATIETQPLVHFAACTEIEGKDNQWVRPVPNALQFAIDEAYDYCQQNKIPCRLIVLKPRQVGCSTKVAHTCYHHMRTHKASGLIISDTNNRAVKVWELFQKIETHDSYPWRSKIVKTNTIGIDMAYPDGEIAKVEHGTAMDEKAGISGTRQWIWWTEAARYMKSGGRDKKVMAASMISLANTPNSLGIAESTAEGAAGWFYETWQKAVTLRDRKSGKRDSDGNLLVGNGWIKVFAPWFAFTEHQLPRKPEYQEYFKEDLDSEERRGVDLFGWTPEQIAWRRLTIARECGGDEKMFQQDFPSDSQSAFLSSGRPRFDQRAVAKLEAEAIRCHSLAETGTVERSSTGEVAFMPATDGDAWLWVSERPQPGLEYISGVDPCTAAQAEGSEFPDAHACGILRKGYQPTRGPWKPTKLVAIIDVPTGCRWDDEVVAERWKRVLDWYGDCLCVVDTGNGLGCMNELKRAGVNLYEREKMDLLRPGKKLKVAGWDTNEATRPLVVNAIANAIREEQLDCTYLPAIQEFKSFIINSRGKAEAKFAAHDDIVMMLGMSLCCIELAAPLIPPSFYLHDVDTRSTPAIPGGPVVGSLS